MSVDFELATIGQLRTVWEQQGQPLEAATARREVEEATAREKKEFEDKIALQAKTLAQKEQLLLQKTEAVFQYEVQAREFTQKQHRVVAEALEAQQARLQTQFDRTAAEVHSQLKTQTTANAELSHQLGSLKAQSSVEMCQQLKSEMQSVQQQNTQLHQKLEEKHKDLAKLESEIVQLKADVEKTKVEWHAAQDQALAHKQALEEERAKNARIQTSADIGRHGELSLQDIIHRYFHAFGTIEDTHHLKHSGDFIFHSSVVVGGGGSPNGHSAVVGGGGPNGHSAVVGGGSPNGHSAVVGGGSPKWKIVVDSKFVSANSSTAQHNKMLKTQEVQKFDRDLASTGCDAGFFVSRQKLKSTFIPPGRTFAQHGRCVYVWAPHEWSTSVDTHQCDDIVAAFQLCIDIAAKHAALSQKDTLPSVMDLQQRQSVTKTLVSFVDPLRHFHGLIKELGDTVTRHNRLLGEDHWLVSSAAQNLAEASPQLVDLEAVTQRLPPANKGPPPKRRLQLRAEADEKLDVVPLLEAPQPLEGATEEPAAKKRRGRPAGAKNKKGNLVLATPTPMLPSLAEPPKPTRKRKAPAAVVVARTLVTPADEAVSMLTNALMDSHSPQTEEDTNESIVPAPSWLRDETRFHNPLLSTSAPKQSPDESTLDELMAL